MEGRTVDHQSVNMKRGEKLGSVTEKKKSHWEIGNNDYLILLKKEAYTLAMH